MTKRLMVVLLAAAMLLGFAQGSQAALTAVGPTSPATGYFPVWYQDSARQLELCLSKTVGPNGPMCVLLPAPPFFDPALPVAFPVNFPDEGFYFVADAAVAQSGIDLTYRAGLEAAFATGGVTNGAQITFARIRIRVDVPVAGTYIITHPYGIATFNVATPGVKAINDTVDVGVSAGVFTGALGGAIGPFLTRAAGLITLGTETFIGDPNVTQTVTGSLAGNNFVRIQGPAGSGIDVTTNQFTLAGKVFGGVLPANVSVDRSTYSRTAAGAGQVDVFSTADPGATLSVRDTLDPLASTPTPMVQQGTTGKFYAKEIPAVIPSFVVVTATQATATPTNLASPVVDVVKITKAQYALDIHTLRIEANLSDQVSPPTLTAVGFGELAAGTLNAPAAQPPARVTVVSSQGGRDTEPVQIVPTFVVAVATTTSITAPAVTFPANGLVTVTVTSAAGTPTGDVSLNVEGGAAITQALDAAGSTTFTLTSPAVGSHALSASYAGDATFAASTGTGTLLVNPAAAAATATSITAPAVTSPANGLVTVTVTSAAGTPTGNVALTVDSGAAITQALDAAGSTTFTLTSPAVGSHALSASYAGDATFAASTGTGTLLVNPAAAAATATSITAPAVTSPANGLVTVTVSSAAGTPTGNVSLSVDGGAAVTQALDAAGSTTFTLTSPAVGSHALSASYAGTAAFAASAATGTLLVNPAAAAATTTSITAPAVTSPANGLVTVIVTSAAGTPTGNVALTVDGGAAITQALGATGSTTFTLTSPAVGTHILSATYAGTATFAASSATGSLVVNPAAVVETITATATAQITRKQGVVTGASWTINGTTNVLTPVHTMTVRLNSTGVQIDGTVTTDARGRWKVTARQSAIVPVAGDTITVTSSLGTTQTFPVTIK